MEGVLTEIIEIMVSGITTLGTGVGQGMNNYITSAFINQATEGGALTLTVLGGCCALFGGIALATGLTEKIFYFFTSFGRRT